MILEVRVTRDIGLGGHFTEGLGLLIPKKIFSIVMPSVCFFIWSSYKIL